jgi:hypothetical protein
MERRHLAGIGVTLVLVAGGITNGVRRKAPEQWLPIGVASTGDTVWVDLDQTRHQGTWWGVRAAGRTARDEERTVEVLCSTRAMSTADVPAIRELARAVVDTVCRRTHDTGRVR